MTKEILVKGTLRGNKKGFAFLISDDKNDDIFIPNRKLNGAVHGDIVLATYNGSEGQVVRIIKRGILSVIGTLYHKNGSSYVIPDEPDYFKDILIDMPKKHISSIHQGSKVVVNISENLKCRHVYGTITQVLGDKNDLTVAELCILKSKGFNDAFPAKVEAEADKIEYMPQQNRTDFRDLLTITIDGEDAKDFDDAISVAKDGDVYRLYVHIADVSHYVKKGSAIDVEAFDRTTSVYFPASVFPMLPKSISDGVCSLSPNQDKLTISVVMDIDLDGNVIKSDFVKSVICSNYRMTYTDVTKILNGDKDLISRYMPIVNMLNTAKSLKEILEKKRNMEGAVNFITSEAKITLDEYNRQILNVAPYPYDVSNAIIEQFMILANQTVARFLSQKGYPCIYRVHGSPEPSRLQDFLDVVKIFGLKFDINTDTASPMQFAKLLEEVKGKPIQPVVNKLMLSAMQKAKYSTNNQGHFGLSLEYYCHFTSPIRRYPDLATHRVLKSVIDNDGIGKTDKFVSYLEKAAAHSSLKEIDAEKAERDVDDHYKAVYMSKRIGQVFDGLISGMTQNGVFVALDNTVEGFIHTDNLPRDRYNLNSARFKLSGNKHSYTIGDKIRIRVYKVNVEARLIDFLIEE